MNSNTTLKIPPLFARSITKYLLYPREQLVEML